MLPWLIPAGIAAAGAGAGILHNGANPTQGVRSIFHDIPGYGREAYTPYIEQVQRRSKRSQPNVRMT